MAVYRFRITFEDHDDIYREIDILGKQSYEEFHRAIQEAIGFDNSKDASFFMSDDLWRKGQEIALRPPKNDDDDDYPARGKKEIKPMSKSRVADFIDDPHQRILYVFDPQAKWTLMIELVKILADDPKTAYPRTSKSAGVAPKQYKQVVTPPPVEEEDEEVEDDEEDKKQKAKAVFAGEESYEEGEHPEGEEGEEGSSETAEEGEEGSGEEGEEEPGGDFDAGSFGGDDEF